MKSFLCELEADLQTRIHTVILTEGEEKEIGFIEEERCVAVVRENPKRA